MAREAEASESGWSETRRGRIDLAGVELRTSDGAALLAEIDLGISAGERLAIVGPNGAGKTSLLRLLFGRLRPSRGTVSIDGRDLAGIPLAERGRLIALVAQSDRPDDRLTLAEYVGLGRIPHRGRCMPERHMRIVTEACEKLGLSGLGDRRLATLSGGERQRASIARAMAQEPVILVLDEPTNHLDPRARADMLATVRDIGITVVAVLHDLTLVGLFADRVAVLCEGRVAVHAKPDEALSPRIVRDVFAMDRFAFVNPQTGRSLLVFDSPSA